MDDWTFDAEEPATLGAVLCKKLGRIREIAAALKKLSFDSVLFRDSGPVKV